MLLDIFLYSNNQFYWMETDHLTSAKKKSASKKTQPKPSALVLQHMLELTLYLKKAIEKLTVYFHENLLMKHLTFISQSQHSLTN